MTKSILVITGDAGECYETLYAVHRMRDCVSRERTREKAGPGLLSHQQQRDGQYSGRRPEERDAALRETEREACETTEVVPQSNDNDRRRDSSELPRIDGGCKRRSERGFVNPAHGASWRVYRIGRGKASTTNRLLPSV